MVGGKSITLQATYQQSFVANLIPPVVNWYVQVNGDTWLSVADAVSKGYIATQAKSDKNINFSTGTQSKLTFTTSSYAGTLRFQADMAYLGVDHQFSDIAEVDVYNNDIATSAIAITGDDYLTKGSTTQYVSTTNPVNATCDITWTSDNTAVATVDPITGVVSGVASGVATITVTITNADGSIVSSSKIITVGNGLVDQKVNVGDNLTWSPEGINLTSLANDGAAIKYQWYKGTSPSDTTTGTAVSGATSAAL